MFKLIKREFGLAKKLMAFSTLCFIAQVVGAMLPLLIAKFFTEVEFGSFSLAKMIVFFAATLTMGATQRPFIVYANEERALTGKINKSFSVQLTLLFFGILASGATLLVFHNPIARFAGIGIGDLVFVFLALAGFSGKFFFCNLLMALGERIQNGIAGLIYACLNITIIILFYVFGYLNLRTIFLSYFLSMILLVLLRFKILDLKLLAPFTIDRQHLRKTLNFAKWVFLGSTAAYFINWGDNLVLRIFVPLGEIGVYNFAYQLFKGLLFTTGIINQYFLPFIVTHITDHSKIRDYLFNKRPKIILLGVVVWIGVFFAVPLAIEFVYGGKYLSAVPVFQILSIALLFRLYITFYNPLYNALERYRFTTFATIVQITVNLLLAFALVPYYGIKGAAAATVCAYLCKLIIFEIYYQIFLRRTYRK